MSENQTPETDVQNEAEATSETGVRTRSSMEDFVKAWETSESVAEAADKLGITKQSAGQRASTYRNKHGIPLKIMPRGGGSRINVKAANDLIAQLRGDSEQSAEGEQAPAETAETAEA